MVVGDEGFSSVAFSLSFSNCRLSVRRSELPHHLKLVRELITRNGLKV